MRTIERESSPQEAASTSTLAGGEDWQELLSRHKLPLSRQPTGLSPQLAVLQDAPPPEEDWLFEIKYDGYRMLAHGAPRAAGGTLQLRSRNNKEWSGAFRRILAALDTLPKTSFILDGEVVVLRPDGSSDFQALQNMLSRGTQESIETYVVFDVLYLSGRNLMSLPLKERKTLLSAFLGHSSSGALRYCEHLEGSGNLFFSELCRKGLEGMIAKRPDAAYQQKRSRDWRKIRCERRDDFRVVGMTQLSRDKGVAALLLAEENSNRRTLRYVGKVGTGFSEASRRYLFSHLLPFRRSTPLLPELNPVSEAIWLEPVLSIEVRYSERTNEGRLRHPVFQGIRYDKSELAMPPSVLRRRANARGKSAMSNNQVRDSPELSSPERVVYPEKGYTKRDVWEYYRKVAEHLLASIAFHPLSIVRCPEGVGDPETCFFQKHPDTASRYLKHIELEQNGSTRRLLYVERHEDLLQLVQFNAIEFHIRNSTIDAIDRPQRAVFDLDPGEGVDRATTAEAAEVLREVLQHLDLPAFLKTSGGKGLHVVVPLVACHETEEVLAFSRAVSELLARTFPALFTATQRKSERKGKIYVDYLRNSRGATAIAEYSTRARPGATVSLPIRWDELDANYVRRSLDIQSTLRRLAALRQEPWHDFYQSLAQLGPEVFASLGISKRGD